MPSAVILEYLGSCSQAVRVQSRMGSDAGMIQRKSEMEDAVSRQASNFENCPTAILT